VGKKKRNPLNNFLKTEVKKKISPIDVNRLTRFWKNGIMQLQRIWTRKKAVLKILEL